MVVNRSINILYICDLLHTFLTRLGVSTFIFIQRMNDFKFHFVTNLTSARFDLPAILPPMLEMLLFTIGPVFDLVNITPQTPPCAMKLVGHALDTASDKVSNFMEKSASALPEPMEKVMLASVG